MFALIHETYPLLTEQKAISVAIIVSKKEATQVTFSM